MDGGFAEPAVQNEDAAQIADEALLLERLRQHMGQSRKAQALDIGRLVFEQFFGGDEAAFRSQAPNKQRSLRDFVDKYRNELRAMKLPASTLRNHVAAWWAWNWLDAAVRERLSATSMASLSCLADDAARAEANRLLLARLQAGATDAELNQLATEVVAEHKRQKLRQRGQGKPGRRPLAAVVKAGTELQRVVNKCSRLSGDLPRLNAAERKDLAAQLQHVAKVVSELQAKLRAQA